MAQAITGNLSDLFPDTVTVEPYSSQGGFGDETYASGVSRSARVGAGGDLMYDEDGNEFVSRGKVIFAGAYGVQEKDRLTLPSDFRDTSVLVKRATPIRDENGAHHDVAFF